MALAMLFYCSMRKNATVYLHGQERTPITRIGWIYFRLYIPSHRPVSARPLRRHECFPLPSGSFSARPLCSIYFKGVRDGLFHFSLRTLYKYCKVLGLKKYALKNFKPKHGLTSKYANQYWNADITLYRSADGVLHYIYLVMDHYSKKILSWAISQKKCGKTRVLTFRTAVLNYLQTAQIEIPNHLVQLIVDAGSENNNGDVDGFLSKVRMFLKKVIALKDIVHSNSPIEAVNKIVKNSYLNKMTIENGNALEKTMQYIVGDYNNRPHGSLNGLTPNEQYDMQAVDIPKNFAQQTEQRKQYNKNYCCKNTT
jgi:putative transposase